jgi:putative endopeptidase
MKNALLLLLALLAAACATAPKPVDNTQPPPRALIGPHGFDLSGLDRTVAPCDDFYEYSAGGWRKSHPLPSTYSRFGRFEEVAERNRDRLRAILEESAKSTNAEKGSNTQKIGDFWNACMNESAIEAGGIAPIRNELRRIDDLRTRADIVREIHALTVRGVAPLFRISGQNDQKNSQAIIAALTQAGLGLPDRDYYLRDNFDSTRKEYAAHMAKMFELAGVPAAHAASDAQKVIALETELARASMARVDQRNPENVYHITPVSELQAFAPNFEWPALLEASGLRDLRSLNVAQPEFFKEANRLLADTPVDVWKAYLRWNVIDAAAPLLSTPFVAENFHFRSQVLSGQTELEPRWRRCVRAADTSIGEIVGQEYVKRAFTPEAKQKMNELIDNLIAALRETIPTLDWMGQETERAALAKLDAFRRRIGYPDKWIDYASLDVGRESFAENVFAARAFGFRRSMSRIGKPDDPNEWGFFTPATVNAGYNPSRNDITFPAGILQAPFYDPGADMAYNYGGIGTVIGHEMTHGFDDQGAKFDAQGNLRNWWTAEDLKNFQSRAECIAKEYGAFPVEQGLTLQGKLVTGEAIADLGGATLAYRAYQKYLAAHGRDTIDGFSPEQRFFLGFAQVWGQNMSPEEARRRALTDPHAPGPNRVNGTVSNMPEFARAWICGEKSQMVRAAGERCAIW